MKSPESNRRISAWLGLGPITRRLWLTVAASTVYTAGVYFLETDHTAGSAGWLSLSGSINAIVLGALVAFRTKTAYDRWWEGRVLWGQLTNDSRNLCLKAASLADPPAADRRELARLVTGFPRALMRHLREKGKLADVPGFETDPSPAVHVPAEIARRVFALVAGWRAAGRIDGFVQVVLDAHVTALMNVCGSCERIRNTPLPGSYLALQRHGLILSFLLLPWHLTHLLGLWALPVQAIAVYFLFGVELTAEELEEPFGYDSDDLPLERFCTTIRDGAVELLGIAPTAVADPVDPPEK